MSEGGADFWTDDTSVLFTSFWGWTPKTWATVGWSNEAGRAHRDKLLRTLTDPFITVIYVTRDPSGSDKDLEGKIAGFYLMSHETGDRDQFTHPVHHPQFPEKWQHSLRALRAFSYIRDPLLDAKEFESSLSAGSARTIARWGKVLTDPAQIARLRETPWREVPIYRPDVPSDVLESEPTGNGMVGAGPAATRPYVVSPSAASMGRRLYVFRLDGDTDAYLGKSAGGRFIYKIGVATSPATRRRDLQKGMPKGAFIWTIDRSSPGESPYTFKSAVAGENAMKQHLARYSEHLGGEFYLATEQQIEEAWRQGVAAADQFVGPNER